MPGANEQLSLPDSVAATLDRVAGLSPKTLLDAADDPSVLQHMARMHLAIELGRMSKLANSPAMTITQRISYIEKLSRVAGMNDIDARAVSAHDLPQIVINIPDYGAQQLPNAPHYPALSAIAEVDALDYE